MRAGTEDGRDTYGNDMTVLCYTIIRSYINFNINVNILLIN